MKSRFEIAVFEGDGIGPEVMATALMILEHLHRDASGYELSFKHLPAGATHYAQTGTALPESSLTAARQADAILLSAMGLPSIRYADGTEISPQLDLRKALDLFAGVRPVTVRPGQLSPLNIADGEAVDFVLIRESTEGLFWSQGRGEVTADEARETMVITRETSRKLFEFAFKLARQRKAAGLGPGKVTCVDKANVFRAFAFFREVFNGVSQDYPDIEADHAYVDAVALWMVQKPAAFDVLVTENMFGDILSDLGAGIMGGLGLAPSADIGAKHAVFQPCHGSAPDIAGAGIANPLAMILSACMMIERLGQEHDNRHLLSDANRLREAVEQVIINDRHRTKDQGGESTTTGVANAVLETLFK